MRVLEVRSLKYARHVVKVSGQTESVRLFASRGQGTEHADLGTAEPETKHPVIKHQGDQKLKNLKRKSLTFVAATDWRPRSWGGSSFRRRPAGKGRVRQTHMATYLGATLAWLWKSTTEFVVSTSTRLKWALRSRIALSATAARTGSLRQSSVTGRKHPTHISERTQTTNYVQTGTYFKQQIWHLESVDLPCAVNKSPTPRTTPTTTRISVTDCPVATDEHLIRHFHVSVRQKSAATARPDRIQSIKAETCKTKNDELQQ